MQWIVDLLVIPWEEIVSLSARILPENISRCLLAGRFLFYSIFLLISLTAESGFIVISSVKLMLLKLIDIYGALSASFYITRVSEFIRKPNDSRVSISWTVLPLKEKIISLVGKLFSSYILFFNCLIVAFNSSFMRYVTFWKRT